MLLLLCGPLAATPAIILEDADTVYTLKGRCDIFIDREGKLGIREVSSPPLDDLFRPLDTENSNFGYTPAAYWLRFTFKQTGEPDVLWLLQADYPLLDRVEFYVPDGKGSFLVRKGGRLYPFEEREYRHRRVVFSLPDERGTYTCYIRIRTAEAMVLDFTILSEHTFAREGSREQYALGIFYGILLAMALYNLFVFIVVRDRSYLYYVLYIASIGIFLLIENGIAYEHLWPGMPWWGQRSHVVFMGLSMFFVTLFERNFIDTRQYVPRLDRVFPVLMGLAFIPVALALFGDYTTAHKAAAFYVGTLAVVVWLTAGIVSWMRGSRPAAFFVIAWVFLLVFGQLSAFSVLLNLSFDFMTMYGMQIGYVMEALLLSMGLADRINTLREQKERAQSEALEQKERAARERMRISRDIHDSIGSELTGIILKLNSMARGSEKDLTGNLVEPDDYRSIAERTKRTLEKLRDIVHIMGRRDDTPDRLEREMDDYLARLESTGRYRITRHIDVVSPVLDAQLGFHVEKIFLEWITNIIRHAGATHIDVRWFSRKGKVYLVIIDNGAGFRWRPGETGGGAGLKNISRRIEAIGARARSFRRNGGGSAFMLIVYQ